MTFGFKIYNLRKEVSKSQIDISKITGIPQTTLSDLENDKYLPDVKQVVLLADFFKLTLDELIRGVF